MSVFKNQPDLNLSLEIKPIGFARTKLRTKFQSPHQVSPSSKEYQESDGARIELIRNSDFIQALKDLDGFSHIWLVWWFNQNNNWKPQVKPPRGPQVSRGVFATRSPYRPNPLGLTLVELHSVSRNVLKIGACDLIDGTPIFDIKPYHPEADRVEQAKIGWLVDIESQSNTKKYSVCLSDLASRQITWLQNNQLDFYQQAIKILENDPSPNRTRRITKLKDQSFRIACERWRIFFELNAESVLITHISCDPKTLAFESTEYQIMSKYLETWPNN